MSAAIKDSHPEELFRFISVRGPIKQDAEERLLFVEPVHERLSASQLQSIGSQHTLLYPELKALDAAPDQMVRSIGLVEAYKRSPDFLPSAAQYPARYPELARFADWLDANADSASNESVIEQARPLLDAVSPVVSPEPEPVPVPVGRMRAVRPPQLSSRLIAQVVLWDNLFANIFRVADAQLVTLACKYLGTLNLLDVLSDVSTDSGAPRPRLAPAYRSRPLLPRWLVTLSAKLDLKPDEGVDGNGTEGGVPKNDGRARFIALSEASARLQAFATMRLRTAVQTQDAAAPRPTPPAFGTENAQRQTDSLQLLAKREIPATLVMASPFRVSSADLETLGAPMVTLARELTGEQETFDLEHLIAAVNLAAISFGGGFGAVDPRRAIKVGNTIIQSDEFCADMIDKDPCGRSPRRNFESRGSFVTSTLIGDLLVTKQQLVKYDLGEVAHVESAMVGLTKQRTHRRLNRSEEFSLTETETTTEEERETQTTDRFDMEKESSQVINQNFSVDSGVSVTGSYGAMQFNSTLDASYGYSSQQAQSDATSFSKSVTTRALSRVKEKVRRVKTVTLINEVEETSVHQLTNDTGDNVNGVYRWLDKYYLNKIINYGKRLLFEFAIPEPARTQPRRLQHRAASARARPRGV
ncbi:MAG: hypothetical protein QOI58_784 [Thermoanaerobaculia bacterium]|jgi:hypothetical protein|nr:hypothetical protein [Thermoanaerobaculia bacterium]